MLFGWLAQLGECRTAERLAWKKTADNSRRHHWFPWEMKY